MAQLINVKLSRFDGSPWGFRLQGGKDFGTPLVVQKVNSGSPAEAAGLKAGDAVIKVNTTDMYNLRHKDAQDVIVRAGNNFEIMVQRGGGTWKPHVMPTTVNLPSPMHTSIPANITPVTKTSLAAKKQDRPLIGSGHNFSPKPFLNGVGDNSIKSIVNKQYNSPVGIYSEETIAETLSAQAEVLAGGVLGVNFKKNEKNYNAENSEVFKMVQEADKEPKTPEPVPSRTEFYSSVSHAVGGRATSPRSPTPLFHAMGGNAPAAPPSNWLLMSNCDVEKHREQQQKQESAAAGSPMPGGVICNNCDRIIVGVFVRIKDKNLHVECFKCSTCGTSLKNVGYYNINNKLYCDIHAKMVARQSAPTDFVPITVSPSGKAPAGTISAALASAPLSPPLSNHGASPQPFSTCNRTSPDFGSQHTQPSTSNMNGYFRNGECKEESKTFTSTIIIQTSGTESVHLGTSPVDSSNLLSVQTPTSNNLIGPKPFGGPSNFTSNLSSTSISNTGSSILPRPQSHTVTKTSSDIYETSCCYEVVEDTRSQSLSNSVKSRSLAWPPLRSTKDITYPTASPLYINPNPVLDRKNHHTIREKRANIEAFERALSRKNKRRSESADREVDKVSRECIYHSENSTMNRISGLEPGYRRIELVGTRISRSDVTPRSSSTDGIRRSLTPTRIVQPIPKPWTAAVSNVGTNLYEQSYAPQEQPTICKKFVQQEVCHQEQLSSSKEQSYREEQRAFKAEICRKEHTIYPGPLPICDKSKQSPAEIVKEINTKVIDLRGNEANEPEIQSKKIQSDFITEKAEEIIDGLHIKQSATFEKTIEKTPERSNTPVIEEVDEIKSECFTRRTDTHVNREVEDITKERTVKEFAETVTSAIDAQQMLEKVKQEEEEKKKQEEEEERKREEERRTHEEEKKKCRNVEERHNQEKKEEMRKNEYEAFSNEEEVEEVREQPLGRTVVREERITETDTTPGRCMVTKETYEEITEEVLVQERVKKRGIEDKHRESLREQVEVHQRLRDQQVPEKRIIAKYDQRSQQEAMEMCKKKVQFLKESETKHKPPSDTSIENSTSKECNSEMVNDALTTTSDRPYMPLNATSSIKELYTEETIYLDHKYKPKPLPPKEDIRPISPFQQALTIAPERSYTSLNREIRLEDQEMASRSQTPSIQMQDSCCPPLDILYDETKKISCAQEQFCTKQSGPQPLPTPPPDFRLKDISTSSAGSRSNTPSSKFFATSLKKPYTIPVYQKYLVTMKKGPVEDQPSIPSRTPTPILNKPKYSAQKLSEPSTCCMKTQVRQIQKDSPLKRESIHFPSRKTIFYNVEENTDTSHKKQEYSASRNVNYDEKETHNLDNGSRDALYAQFQETRCMTSEEDSEQQNTTSHVKKALQVVEDYEKCEQKEALSTLPLRSSKDICDIDKVNHTKVSLPCHMSSQASPVPAKSTYSSSTEVRHVRYKTPSPSNCNKFTTDSIGNQSMNLPFPQIPLPCEEISSSAPQCPPCIKSRINLSGQLTGMASMNSPSMPTIQLYKPQTQSQVQGQFQTQSYIENHGHTQGYREIYCVSGNSQAQYPYQTQNHCQDQIHCLSSKIQNLDPPNLSSYPDLGTGIGGLGGKGSSKSGSFAGSSAPKRGRGILNQAVGSGSRIPLCAHCNSYVRGPFITALGQIWCPDHFVCVNAQCRRPLQDIGFVEEKGQLYCEYCFEKYIAPTCDKCNNKVKGDCLNAIGKHFHPECFNCAYCGKLFGNTPFFLEEGLPYCEADWNELFTTKCFACGFPVEAGDRWVEALNNNYHSQCFNCTMCKKNLEGQSFYAKGGRPFCKNHAR